MKYIAKIKNKSRFKGSDRHKVPGKEPHTSPPSATTEQAAKGRSPSAHDPEYYHSDNRKNRLVIGEGEEAQSPHMHYEDE